VAEPFLRNISQKARLEKIGTNRIKKFQTRELPDLDKMVFVFMQL